MVVHVVKAEYMYSGKVLLDSTNSKLPGSKSDINSESLRRWEKLLVECTLQFLRFLLTKKALCLFKQTYRLSNAGVCSSLYISWIHNGGNRPELSVKAATVPVWVIIPTSRVRTAAHRCFVAGLRAEVLLGS